MMRTDWASLLQMAKPRRSSYWVGNAKWMSSVMIELKFAMLSIHARMGRKVAPALAARCARRLPRLIVPPLKSGNAIARGLSALRVRSLLIDSAVAATALEVHHGQADWIRESR